MKEMKKNLVPALIYVVAFFILPLLDTHVFKFTNLGIGFGIQYLVIFNSAAVFIASLYMTLKHGLQYQHIIIMAVLFIIAAYVVYNDSALVYLFFYIFVEIIALAIGYMLLKPNKK